MFAPSQPCRDSRVTFQFTDLLNACTDTCKFYARAYPTPSPTPYPTTKNPTATPTATPTKSTDASLSSITSSSGSLTPTFSGSSTTYTITVANSIGAVTLTPTIGESHQTIQYDKDLTGVYTSQSSAAATGTIFLIEGCKTSVRFMVTAWDTTVTKVQLFTIRSFNSTHFLCSRNFLTLNFTF